MRRRGRTAVQYHARMDSADEERDLLGERDLPDWRVLVVGGASGMGKTGVGRALARRYGVPVVEADDIVEAFSR